MGQYHIVVNLYRCEYLKPTELGDGLELLEFSYDVAKLTALAILLAKDNGRGLGDLHVAMPDTPLDKWEKADYVLKRVRARTLTLSAHGPNTRLLLQAIMATIHPIMKRASMILPNRSVKIFQTRCGNCSAATRG